jgi:crossover junction endodeoxyribonuclease RuvC
MLIAGIDYSLTTPAICVAPYKKTFGFEDCKFHFLTAKKKASGSFAKGQINGKEHRTYKIEEQRYNNISTWALEILNEVEYVVIEDYSFGSKGRVFHIAENTGLLKHQLWRFNKTFSVAAPTTIKKFATGKGNSDKDAMYDAFFKETQFNLKNVFDQESTASPVSDLVDSFYMCKYAFNKLSCSKVNGSLHSPCSAVSLSQE